MDVLIGILFILIFLVGFGLGLFVPMIIRKYFDIFSSYQDEINTLKKQLEDNNTKTENVNLPDNEIINEWLNGGDEREE